MLCSAALSQARIASRSNLATQVSKRCFSYEDRGRMRCEIKTEPFTSDLMEIPKKKKQVAVSQPMLDGNISEYTTNMQLGTALGKPTRYDDLYYSCAKKAGPRRYAQTWVEGPEPTAQPSLLSELDKHIDPAPIERRSKDERPKTAKPISSYNRRFHCWYRKLMKH